MKWNAKIELGTGDTYIAFLCVGTSQTRNVIRIITIVLLRMHLRRWRIIIKTRISPYHLVNERFGRLNSIAVGVQGCVCSLRLSYNA